MKNNFLPDLNDCTQHPTKQPCLFDDRYPLNSLSHLVRRTNFELAKARARQHILDGYLIALNNLDAVIKTIRESQDADVAKANLVTRFKLSEIQAQAILDMQLRRLAALERWKIEEEHKQVAEQIARLEDLLAHPKKILALIQDEIGRAHV